MHGWILDIERRRTTRTTASRSCCTSSSRSPRPAGRSAATTSSGRSAGQREAITRTAGRSRAQYDAVVEWGIPDPTQLRRIPRAVHEGLHRRAGPVATHDRLRPDRFARRPGSLDARPRYRQLREDLPRLPRRATLRRPHPGPHPRQHPALLADKRRGPGRAHVLGKWAGHPPPEVSLPVAFTVFPGEIFQPRAAGPRRPTPTSSTSTRPAEAASSPPGKSRTCSPPKSGAAFRSLR